MDEDELVHELVNSLAFEVEAIPADNIIKFTSTNGTPLSVKVRVRNKDEPRLVQRGIVSVPKLSKHIASVDKIRLISSDQTILSFNVYMETELDKQSPPKNRKQGFKFFKLGGCLGTSYDEDEGPYLPGPPSKKGLRSRSSSKSGSDLNTENMDVAKKLKLSHPPKNAGTRDQKKLFGKCKPGGCLDPPFGEDKEPYRPENAQSRIKSISKVEDSKIGQKISASSVEPGKSSKAPTNTLKKESNKGLIEPKPLLDIYARPVSVKHSSTSNYSNATTRHSSKMSSSKMLEAGKNNSKTYNDDSLRQSYQYPETYFIPPKDLLQHKEEERRYSRERSNHQIRPTTTRHENDHQTSNISHMFDVPNVIYPENVDGRSPQNTKLSKPKGKDNTERIKQTLTDLTSNEIDNAPKTLEDFWKNNTTLLNVPLVTQKVETTSNYKETPSADVTYLKNVDDFDIPITLDDLDLSIISKCDADESKNPKEANSEELLQNFTPTKNKEAIEINPKGKPIMDKSYGPENKNLSKNMRNKNDLQSDEPMDSVTINTTKLESVKLEDLNISPALVSGQDEVNILQSVSSLDTQKSQQIDHLPYDLNGILEDKPTKTSEKHKKTTDSELSPKFAKDETKMLMTVRLSSLENFLDVDDTSEKNPMSCMAMSESQLNDSSQNEKKDTNVYQDTTKYVDDIHNLLGRKTSKGQTNESQELKDSKPINEKPNLLDSGVDDEINKSSRVCEIPTKHIRSPNILDNEVNDDKISKALRTDEIPKEQTKSPKLLVSEADDDKINKSSRTDETTKNQINGNKHIQEEQIQDPQIINKLETDMVQKPFNNFPVFKDSERNILQDLDLKTNEKFENLVGVETYEKSNEDKLGKLKSEETPSNDAKVKDELEINMDLITNQKQMQSSTPSEIPDNQVLNEQYRRIERNENINIVRNSVVEDLKTIRSNKHIADIPDMKDVKLNNDEDFKTVNIINLNNITNVTSENLEKFNKQVQDCTYTKNELSDNNVTSSEYAFDLDSRKHPSTANAVDSGHIKHQPIDASIINNKTSPIRNSSHLNILNTDTNFAASSTNSIETSNLKYDDNAKAPLNLNLTDNDVIIKKFSSLNDRNKNLNMNTHDKIPSAILQKPPLLKTDDSNFRNDDINVIKPFKRNTFTIVASSTSLEKQEEPMSIQETNYTKDEHEQFKGKLALNDQITTDSERSKQPVQQNNNDFIVDAGQETIIIDPFLNISAQSDTSLKIDDKSTYSYSATENQSKDLGSPEQQRTDIKILSNTTFDDEARTINYDKSDLASAVASSDISIANNEIPKSQDQTDNKMYNKEKLISNKLSDDLVKQISELQDRSDDLEYLQTEPKIHNNEKNMDDVQSKKNTDTTSNNTTVQLANSPFPDNADGQSNNKNSILNMFIKETEGSSKAVHTKDTEDKAPHEGIVTIMSNEKSDTNNARSAMEYGSRLLEMSEDKFGDTLGEPKNSAADIYSSIIGRELDEYTSKLFSVDKSEKVVDSNAELDTQPIYIRDQSATIIDDDDKGRKKMDFGAVKSVNKVLDKNSLMPEDYDRHYVENETNTDSQRKMSDSGTIGSFNNVIDENSLEPKDNIRYNSKYDNHTKIDDDSNLKNISKLYSVEIVNENIDKTSIVSKDGIKYHSEHVSPNSDLRKISKLHSEGDFNQNNDKKPPLVNYDTAHNIAYESITKADEDVFLSQQSDANAIGPFDKVIDKISIAANDSIGYSSKFAASSNTPIAVVNLSNNDQFGAKHFDITQNTKQSDSIDLKPDIGIKERVQNQNRNTSNKTDHEETISRPIHKTKSETLILNLALQSYVNENNDTVVQTISPLAEPVRYIDDNITVVQSLIRRGHEIRIPVDKENDLSLKFTTKTHQIPQNFNTDPNSSKKGRISRNLSEHAHHHPENINKSLAFIYERELIPLHNVIKNLTEEINILTTQQELLKDKMRSAKRTKSLRLIPVSKRCGCGRM